MNKPFNVFPNRCVLIILDGIGDRSFDVLEGKTPLQAAYTPCLDKIAKEGANGLFHATFQGQPLSSETAHYVIFGYDLSTFPGRGSLEALGEGIELGKSDVAMLSHFVSVQLENGHFRLVDGKPEMTEEEILAFSETLKHFQFEDETLEFISTGGYRGILRLSGISSPAITDTDPFFEDQLLIEPVPLLGFENHPASVRTALSLKAYLLWAHKQLSRHSLNKSRSIHNKPPINALVTQRAGQLKQVPSFKNQLGIDGISISSGPMYRGLCRYIGLEQISDIESNDPEIELTRRIEKALEIRDEYSFIHVHSKWPDKAAHTKDPEYKMRVIESLDSAIGKTIEVLLEDPQTLVVIAADHSTPSSGPQVHCGESVPVIFHGKGVRKDNVTLYDEVSAALGSLGLLRGKELIYSILNAVNQAKLQGIMQTPDDRPIWTTDYKPLTG